MPTPKQPDQRPIPITQDEGYYFNMEDGIWHQNKIPNTNCIQLQNSNAPNCISQTALYYYLGNAIFDDTVHFLPTTLMGKPTPIQPAFDIEEVENGMVHPITNGTIKKYHKLIDEPLLREFWMKEMRVELGCLAQGYKDTKGTYTIRLMKLD